MIPFGPAPRSDTPASSRCRMAPAPGFVRTREMVRPRSIFLSEVYSCSRQLLVT